jgi:hypothetical protein
MSGRTFLTVCQGVAYLLLGAVCLVKRRTVSAHFAATAARHSGNPDRGFPREYRRGLIIVPVVGLGFTAGGVTSLVSVMAR